MEKENRWLATLEELTSDDICEGCENPFKTMHDVNLVPCEYRIEVHIHKRLVEAGSEKGHCRAFTRKSKEVVWVHRCPSCPCKGEGPASRPQNASPVIPKEAPRMTKGTILKTAHRAHVFVKPNKHKFLEDLPKGTEIESLGQLARDKRATYVKVLAKGTACWIRVGDLERVRPSVEED